MNIREVRRHGDGWGVFDPNASRASAVERTQAAAQERARAILANQGGGEMRTRGENARTEGSAHRTPSSLGTIPVGARGRVH